MRSAQTGYIKLGLFYKAYKSTTVDLSLNGVRYPCDYCGHKASGKGNLKTHISLYKKIIENEIHLIKTNTKMLVYDLLVKEKEIV